MREQTKTMALSLALHGGVFALLASVAVTGLNNDSEEPIAIEIVVLDDPAELELDEPEPPEPLPIPSEPRPVVVPRQVKIAKVEKPKPFQQTPVASGDEPAPDDVEAVPAPTAPVLSFSMEATVGGGNADYESTTVGSSDTQVARSGPASGAPGPIGNQGAVGVSVAKDWQVTSLPVPTNDRDFEPDYPALAKREGREASVRLALDVGLDGQVVNVRVLGGPKRYGFRQAAIAYARKLRFKPARAGANTVAARIEWTVYFYVHN